MTELFLPKIPFPFSLSSSLALSLSYLLSYSLEDAFSKAQFAFMLISEHSLVAPIASLEHSLVAPLPGRSSP